MNTGFRSALFILGLSASTFVPPPPPPPSVSSPGMVVPISERAWGADKRYEELQRQNEDDIEVVQILTQFLEETDG